MSATKKASALGPFELVAAPSKPTKKRRRPGPLSIRVSDEEREELRAAARGASLNAYVRSRLFDKEGRVTASRRRQPVKDQAALARALALLGALDVSKSLRDLADAARTGALEVDPETEEELQAASAAILAIKSDLMRALGYDDGGSL